MASPLNNPWISGGLGVGILVYFTVAFTPEAWKQPLRDFFTGELKREGGREPEFKTGTERLFRAVARAAGGDRVVERLAEEEPGQRKLFREISKGGEKKTKEAVPVPEVPEGSGLLAVWMDGETRVAVMTDGTVREGEVWGEFEVEKITPEAVTLRHVAGIRVVRLGEVRAKPGAAPAAATPPAETRPAEGSMEAELRKIMQGQEAADSGKPGPGLPQQIFDALMGNPKKPAGSN